MRDAAGLTSATTIFAMSTHLCSPLPPSNLTQRQQALRTSPPPEAHTDTQILGSSDSVEYGAHRDLVVGTTSAEPAVNDLSEQLSNTSLTQECSTNRQRSAQPSQHSSPSDCGDNSTAVSKGELWPAGAAVDMAALIDKKAQAKADYDMDTLPLG